MVAFEVGSANDAVERIPKEAMRILDRLASEWSDVADSKALEVVHLKGAMTNQVYQINWPTMGKDGVSRKVLVRIYGDGVDVFFDREDEIRTFECMSRHGQGPRLLGRFPNGRVEEFINARDYEYASFNPIAYDLANHFCEMAADYHTETPHILDFNKYPDYEERKRFVQAYLSSSGETGNLVEIDNLLELIEKYTLASHLVWGLWGIISEHVNDIDFNYMEYAKQRFQQYWLRKSAT